MSVSLNKSTDKDMSLLTFKGGVKEKGYIFFLILNFLYVMRFSMIFNMQLLKNIKKITRFQKNNEKENSIHFCS